MTIATDPIAPPPRLTAQLHLDATLTRVWLLLQRFVARYGYRMFGSGESFEEAFSGFAQAMAQIQQLGQPIPVEPWHQGNWPSPASLRDQLDRYERALRRQLTAASAAPTRRTCRWRSCAPASA